MGGTDNGEYYNNVDVFDVPSRGQLHNITYFIIDGHSIISASLSAWSISTPMSKKRAGATAATVNGRLYGMSLFQNLSL